MLRTLFFFCVLLSLLGCEPASQTEAQPDKTKTLIKGKTMGTTYSIAIAHPKNKKIDQLQLQTSINTLLRDLNQLVSTYIPNSEISLFNQSTAETFYKISPEFFKIISVAQKISKQSDGAFDISVAPLVNLWGFGSVTRNSVPTDEEITKVKSYIGYDLLKLDDEKHTLQKPHDNFQIDLSAIAKGFAVDKVSDYLMLNNHNDHLVEIGGELKARGLNQSNKQWRIAVEQPDQSNSTVQHGVEITNQAIATSGDYQNFFIDKGVRRSHIIDPKTGYPITHNLASVTVLHDSAMLADAYATALFVMGDKKGKAFSIKNKLDVLMIIRKQDKFENWSSTDLFLGH